MMINLIKQKLNNAWDWTKRNVKKILIGIGILGVATAATIIPILLSRGVPTIGATITNAIDTGTSTLRANHTTDANTKVLVVIIKGYDSSNADSVVSSITFSGIALTEAEYYRNTGDGDDAFVAIYYLSNPVIGEKPINLTMAGSCTDLSWDAVNLVSAGADAIILDNTDTGSTSTANSHTSTIDPAKTDSISVGGIVNKDSTTNNVWVTTGTLITGSEADFGSQTAESAYVAEGGGTTSLVWGKTTTDDSWACSATFYEQFVPTVELNTPTDEQEVSDTTPTLEFTGTDSGSDELEYQIQIDTVDTFDSGYTLNVLIDSYSEEEQETSINIDNDDRHKLGQSFTASQAGKLTYSKLFMRKALSPIGDCYVKLYTHSGVYGVSSLPTGEPLATSDPFDVSTLPGDFGVVTFNFSEDEQYLLENGVYYVLVLEYFDAVGYNTIYWGRDPTATHSGIASQYDGVTWTNAPSTYDFCFYVYATTGNIVLDKKSEIPDAGFLNTENGGDTHPFTSGQKISYTVQEGDAISDDTYYWRVRAKDPSGSNVWGEWSSIWSFIQLIHIEVERRTMDIE